MRRFTDYKEAYAYALSCAIEQQRDFGIRRAKEYEHDGYNVDGLPASRFCFGHELMAERVTPTSIGVVAPHKRYHCTLEH